MAGTAKDYNNARTIWRSCDVWIDCAIPAAGAKPTLHTDGTPESVANPSAKHVGYLRGGTKFLYKWTKKDAMDDQHTAPHRSKRVGEELRIEGRWLQVLDSVLLDSLSSGGTLSTPSGGKLLELGGDRTITTTCVYLIAERVDSPGDYICCIIFAAIPTEGLEFTFSEEDESDSPLGLTGQVIASRADGKQLGSIYIDDPAA